MTAAEWAARLQHSFQVQQAQGENGPVDKLVYLADHIFDFITYDDDMARAFAGKAVEVCEAITRRTTFEYIKDATNYTWFVLMCNMPFFADRIEWGTSIRGAYWCTGKPFQSCGLWDGDNQLHEPIAFGPESWDDFINGLLLFARAP